MLSKVPMCSFPIHERGRVQGKVAEAVCHANIVQASTSHAPQFIQRCCLSLSSSLLSPSSSSLSVSSSELAVSSSELSSSSSLFELSLSLSARNLSRSRVPDRACGAEGVPNFGVNCTVVEPPETVRRADSDPKPCIELPDDALGDTVPSVLIFCGTCLLLVRKRTKGSCQLPLARARQDRTPDWSIPATVLAYKPPFQQSNSAIRNFPRPNLRKKATNQAIVINYGLDSALV